MTSREYLDFYAYGDPAPQGSKRHIGNGRMIEASKKLKPWRAAVADAVFRSYVSTGDDRSFTQPVIVTATFYLPKPIRPKFKLWPATMPDLDKLQRSLGDALSIDAGLLADDGLIVWWNAQKVWAAVREDAGVKVSIRLATDADLAKLDEMAADVDALVCDCCGK